MMSPDYLGHYQQLERAIAVHQRSGLPEMQMVELCFKSSLQYWRKVHRQANQQEFCTTEEEISFFKDVKPAFGARIEFYTFRYHALLFMPAADKLETDRFWDWEQRKMNKFYESNEEFCRYIQAGDTSRDEDYFLRISDLPSGKRQADYPGYDLEEEMSSPMDHLVTTIKAYALYERYIHLTINQNCGLEA
jgi:hypothetical protein